MNIIVAVDKNWGIGYQGDLLLKINEDMKRFKKLTTGGVVIMGRETLDSLPNGSPLPNRTNIVLSRNKAFAREGTIVSHSIEELLDLLPAYAGKAIFVIGGEKIYRQLLPHCTGAYITKIDYSYQADTYFPNLDEDPKWSCVEVGDRQVHQGIAYCFTKYKRNIEMNGVFSIE